MKKIIINQKKNKPKNSCDDNDINYGTDFNSLFFNSVLNRIHTIDKEINVVITFTF